MVFSQVKPGEYFLWPNGDMVCRRMTTLGVDYGATAPHLIGEKVNAIDMADCQPLFFADDERVEALSSVRFEGIR